MKDFNGESKEPAKPTKALPGSQAKIKIMMERAERGEKLFHPQDSKLTESINSKLTSYIAIIDKNKDQAYKDAIDSLSIALINDPEEI